MATFCLGVRDQLAGFLAESEREYPVNIVKRGDYDDVLFVNGRLRNYANLPELVKRSSISCQFLTTTGELAAVYLNRNDLGALPPIVTLPI